MLESVETGTGFKSYSPSNEQALPSTTVVLRELQPHNIACCTIY